MQKFEVLLVGHHDVCVVIAEFLLHPSFRDKGRFLWFAGVWCAMGYLGERNHCRVIFHVSLWASVLKLFFVIIHSIAFLFTCTPFL